MLSFYGNTGDFLYIQCVKDFKYYVCELVNIDTIPCPCPGVNFKKKHLKMQLKRNSDFEF